MPDLKLLVIVRRGRGSRAGQAPSPEEERGRPVDAAESMRKRGPGVPPKASDRPWGAVQRTQYPLQEAARRSGTLGHQLGLLDGAKEKTSRPVTGGTWGQGAALRSILISAPF